MPETPDSASLVDPRQALKARDLSVYPPKRPVFSDATTKKSNPDKPKRQKKFSRHYAGLELHADTRVQPGRPPDLRDPVLSLLAATQLYQEAVLPSGPRQSHSGGSSSSVPPDKGYETVDGKWSGQGTTSPPWVEVAL